MISIDVYDKFMSGWYDEIHVKPIIKNFHIFVKQRLDKLEHISLITEWGHIMDTAAYMEQSQKEYVCQPSRKKKSIVTIAGRTGQK